MAAVLSEQARTSLAPYIQAVLAGEPQAFERHGMGSAVNAHFMVNYLPDINEAGGVDGFYVMAMDITTRKEAELRQAASERLLVDRQWPVKTLLIADGSIDARMRRITPR